MNLDFSHLSISDYILIVIFICGAISHIVPNGSLAQKILNVIGSMTFKANSPAATPTPVSEIISKVSKTSLLIGVVLVSFIGCQPAAKIWDTAYQTCVASMKIEPLVVEAANKKALPLIDYVNTICNVVDVLNPYVQALESEYQDAGPKKLVEPATPRALKAAKEHGLL
jgi:hypothetical protein